eukprot:PhF_6_TR43652/c0_g1_i1/m.67078/K06950/K06950; uncharacterized protein
MPCASQPCYMTLTTKKFFPTHKNCENARTVLDACYGDAEEATATKELVLKMISLVSTTSNGNTTPQGIETWLLYPRFADRLEAVGEIGIERCLSFNDYVKRPMHTSETPMPLTEAELNQVANSERFEGYLKKKTSDSFLDHFYDKLLHVGKPEAFGGCTNPYLVKEAERRHQVLVDYVLKYNKERAA